MCTTILFMVLLILGVFLILSMKDKKCPFCQSEGYADQVVHAQVGNIAGPLFTAQEELDQEVAFKY